MRSYKSSITDENELTKQRLRAKSIANLSSNHTTAGQTSTSFQHREALTDLTSQENKNHPRVKLTQTNTNHHKNSSSSSNKIQIYQQIEQKKTDIHQFKKPRLEKVLLNDDDDETDDEFDDEEDKENRYHDLELNDDDSKHQLISEAFETIDDRGISEGENDTAQEARERLEEETQSHTQDMRSIYGVHVPMQPMWNNAIINELKYVIQKYSRNTLDENDEDTYDTTMVAEYSPEIFNYLHELENKFTPDPNYMDFQDDLKWEMRAVLIDWVVQVHARFNLFSETLYLTVNYIDRFLSKRRVSLSRFQLVGAVALFIAAKYEEINCPTVQEIAYMADNAYSIDEFLKAERFMIDVLEFDLGWPGPMSFLRRISKADDYDYETRTLAKYFLEITIMDSKFVASPPSWLAAGAHYISRILLGRGEWTELHVFYSGYTEKQLQPLADVLLENCRHAEINHKAIFEKYKERRYRKSSLFVQEYFRHIMSQS